MSESAQHFARKEVEEAYQHFIATGDSGDWNAWADLHSEDGVWVEHHLGTFEGREAIREAILEKALPVPDRDLDVRPAHFGENSVAVGAAFTAMNHVDLLAFQSCLPFSCNS